MLRAAAAVAATAVATASRAHALLPHSSVRLRVLHADDAEQGKSAQQAEAASATATASVSAPREEYRKEDTEEDRRRAAEAGYEIPKFECPLCTFIRRGPCYATYFAWDRCKKAELARKQPAAATPAAAASAEHAPAQSPFMEQATGDQEEELACRDEFMVMLSCLAQNRDYYGPLLDALAGGEDDEDDEAARSALHTRRVWDYRNGVLGYSVVPAELD